MFEYLAYRIMSLRNDEEGQGLAEYALILALIAVVAAVYASVVLRRLRTKTS